MKKVGFVSFYSFAILFISSVTAYLLRYVPFENAWEPLVLGVAFLIVSGILALFAILWYPLNYICFALCGIALGFCIRSWYIFREFDNSVWIMLLVSALCVLYLWVFYALSFIPLFKRHPKFFIVNFLLLSLAVYITLIFITKTTFLSTFGYYMIIEISYLFAMCSNVNTSQKLFRNIVLSSFSVLIVAVIIALIMLGGDGVDISGEGLDIFERKKKKKEQIK